MGKRVFKTVLKVAAVAAIGAFAPVLAPAVLSTVGIGASTLATTVASAAIGAGLGEISGVGWKAGLLAGGLPASGLFGGAPAAGTTTAGTTTAGTTAAGTTAAGTTAAGTAAATPAAGLTAGALPSGGAIPTGVAASGGTATLTAAPATLGTALSGAVANVGNTLTQGLRTVAPQVLAAGLTGSPGTGLARAQEAELQRAQQTNAALTQQRLDQANRLIEEAGYFDPEFMGRQAAEAAMIRGGIQETEGTRGLTGERRAAEQRRYRLGTARTAGTAYQQGFNTGVQTRTGTRATGVGLIPTAYPMADVSSAIAAQNAAATQRAARTRGLSRLFGQALGVPEATQQQTEDEAAQRRADEAAALFG